MINHVEGYLNEVVENRNEDWEESKQTNRRSDSKDLKEFYEKNELSNLQN